MLAAAATSMIKVDEPPPDPRESPSWPHLKALAWPIAAAQGAGSVLAGLLGKRADVRVGLLLMAVAALARTTAWLPLVLVSGFVTGVGLAWAVIAVATLVQQRTPPSVLGRVSATAMSIVFGAAPLGLAAGAALVSHLSFEAIYVIIAVLTTAAAVWARGGRARRFTARRPPREAADQME
ncbi:MFS transporter [Lentzea sp. NPDC051838]|uniref:MFS transporter n=1 Tax=Lentzea sp. NPDC051838 TaxID=3154849 RepID=UPI00341749EA